MCYKLGSDGDEKSSKFIHTYFRPRSSLLWCVNYISKIKPSQDRIQYTVWPRISSGMSPTTVLTALFPGLLLWLLSGGEVQWWYDQLKKESIKLILKGSALYKLKMGHGSITTTFKDNLGTECRGQNFQMDKAVDAAPNYLLFVEWKVAQLIRSEKRLMAWVCGQEPRKEWI